MATDLESSYDYGSDILDNMINSKYIYIEAIVIHLFDMINYKVHLN